MISDYNEIEDVKFFSVTSFSVQEINSKIIAAAKDKRIKGLLIEPKMIMTNYPALGEMSLAIETFQKRPPGGQILKNENFIVRRKSAFANHDLVYS